MPRILNSILNKIHLNTTHDAAHLDEHLDARDSLEGQQQEGHEGQALAQRRLLQPGDDLGELGAALPEDIYSSVYISAFNPKRLTMSTFVTRKRNSNISLSGQ